MESPVSPWSFCYFLLFISTKFKHFEFFSEELHTSIGCAVEYFPFWVPVSTQEPSMAILNSESFNTAVEVQKEHDELGVSCLPDQDCRSLQIQPLSLTLSQQVQTREQLRALRWQLRISLLSQEVRQLNQGYKITPRAGLKIIKT